MENKELTKKLRELKKLQAHISELETAVETLKDEIKAEMTARNTDEIKADVYTVRWQTIISKRFDNSAFSQTHKALYDQYSKEITMRRFTMA